MAELNTVTFPTLYTFQGNEVRARFTDDADTVCISHFLWFPMFKKKCIYYNYDISHYKLYIRLDSRDEIQQTWATYAGHVNNNKK